MFLFFFFFFFFFQAEDGIRDLTVTGVQTCALPIWRFASQTVDLVAARANRRNPWFVSIHGAPEGIALFSSSVVLMPGQTARSEERRVGKECRSRWSPYH